MRDLLERAEAIATNLLEDFHDDAAAFIGELIDEVQRLQAELKSETNKAALLHDKIERLEDEAEGFRADVAELEGQVERLTEALQGKHDAMVLAVARAEKAEAVLKFARLAIPAPPAETRND